MSKILIAIFIVVCGIAFSQDCIDIKSLDCNVEGDKNNPVNGMTSDGFANLEKVANLEAQSVTIRVLGVVHKYNSEGLYFNFNSNDIDHVLGTYWSNMSFQVKNLRTGKTSCAIIWRNTQRYDLVDGSNSHGRWIDGYGSGDWKEDDLIEIRLPNLAWTLTTFHRQLGKCGQL